MEDAGGEVVYPAVEQICEINRRMVEEFGGLFIPPDNLLNLDALEYILDAVKSSLFGTYSTLKEKAAAIAYHIISRHVFHDGNKRTGSHIAWEFLRANGVNLFIEPSVVELTVAVAKKEATQEELLRWLREHQAS